jgi:hypothetical protein
MMGNGLAAGGMGGGMGAGNMSGMGGMMYLSQQS